MAHIKRDESCVLCGSMASAVWWKNTTLAVCKGCAENILPRLISDAIVNDNMSTVDIVNAFDKLKAPFLEAALSYSLRKKKE